MDIAKLHLHWTVKKKNGKEYRSYSLARSHRIEGKVRKEIEVKLGVLSEEEVERWQNLLHYSKTLVKKNKKDQNSVSNLQQEYSMADFQVLLKDSAKKRFEYDQTDKETDRQVLEEAIKKTFSGVRDPREQDNFSYPFYGILLIILAGTLASAKSISAIHEYAQDKAHIFLPLLGIKKIPGYMAFWWSLTRCNTEALNQAFLGWLKSIADSIETNKTKRIAIDGKALRGAKKSTVHYVSAYDNTRGLLLGQVRTEKKSNEITAIPELLKVIDIKNALITIDAAGCQKKSASLLESLKGIIVLPSKEIKGLFLQKLPTFLRKQEMLNMRESLAIERVLLRDLMVEQKLEKW